MRLVVRLHATSLSRPNAVDCATVSCVGALVGGTLPDEAG